MVVDAQNSCFSASHHLLLPIRPGLVQRRSLKQQAAMLGNEVVGTLILPAAFRTFKLRMVTPAAVTEKAALGFLLPHLFERNPNQNVVPEAEHRKACAPAKEKGRVFIDSPA